MENYKGVIIEESLEAKEVLSRVRIVSTKVERVTGRHGTPWLKQWTLHTVEMPYGEADTITKMISNSFERDHAWYADFKNNTRHYVIFRSKIFRIDRKSKEQYDEAKRYGLSLGIPEHQLDFAPDDEVLKR
jgi:hypothetical protein